jgi:hypothetical protein
LIRGGNAGKPWREHGDKTWREHWEKTGREHGGKRRGNMGKKVKKGEGGTDSGRGVVCRFGWEVGRGKGVVELHDLCGTFPPQGKKQV